MLPEKSRWIKVLCEKCLKARDSGCFICGGSSFYYWDSNSAICYDNKGKELVIENEFGEKISIVRNVPVGRLESSFLLEFIDSWVKGSPLRKWKLSVDDNGWHSSVWFNRYKKDGCNCAGSSLEDCLLSSYKAILVRTLKMI